MDDILKELTQSIDNNNLELQVRALIQLLQQSTGLESAYFTRIDVDKGVQHIVYSINTGQLQLNEGLSVNWDDTLCKRAIEQQQFVTTDVSACWGDSAAAAELGINTYISAPVELSDGHLYGTVCAASTEKTAVSDKSASLLLLIGRLIAVQVEREKLLQQLALENRHYRNVALTDPLTGLGNRRELELELQRELANSQRSGSAIFVAYIDLDNFKTINDQYGHDAGDRLLLAIAANLKKGRREGDFIARVGGDEFVVFGLLTGNDIMHAAKALREQLFNSTEGRFDIADTFLHYKGGSVGLVIAEPGEKISHLLKRADEEMYRDKKRRATARRY
ncbi:sensor domain-containing diguanylate cyclase [Rheinheimera baltica]|uniref:diguanylate cyclase n=1 Tax=Rheinheimera baltica TaxID=67576 RepID=A0ABT9I1G4_9GAMM|nr:sensor domain-containing diguanylate cyclase [Rheinheimera baltica]MDP5136875.1 sensor domain-containing diguanylate cyclase [Rheinheimera baltica]MDP5144620.1 sensor domain-containing diguanylate cyclase [Rheinheimera baltica]MDP5149333.1 sensor domain-containing diguanylate cyclase [Rheinheimera baltica]